MTYFRRYVKFTVVKGEAASAAWQRAGCKRRKEGKKGKKAKGRSWKTPSPM